MENKTLEEKLDDVFNNHRRQALEYFCEVMSLEISHSGNFIFTNVSKHLISAIQAYVRIVFK